MENVLLRFCRVKNRYSNKKVAASLGITTQEYMEIEKGELMITYAQARQLGKLYKMNGEYFYEAARQLDQLLSCGLVIKILRSENARMNELLKGGYELIHENKERKAEVYS